MSNRAYLDLSPGHHIVPGRFNDATVDVSADDLLVRLVAELSHLEPSTTIPVIPRQATTVEIRMDRKAAMMLAANLDELGRKMGWPRQTGDEGRF